MGNWDPNKEIWMVNSNKQMIEDFQTTVAEAELWRAVLDGTIEEIYWVGGEPLMYDIHWKIMTYLVENDLAKNVIVRYNTNLSRVTYGGCNLYDLLPHFKRVNMCCSQDATGTTAEWIRTGLKWSNWLENFKAGIFLNDIYGMDAQVLDVTLTLPGLLDMESLIDLAVELGVKSYVKMSFDFDPSAIMSPMCLPRHILNPILDRLIKYEQKHGNHLTKIYRETFIDMKTRPTFADKYPNYFQGIKMGKARYQKIADHRRDGQLAITIEDILARDPAVLEWWNNV
jgi:hypothetical protein